MWSLESQGCLIQRSGISESQASGFIRVALTCRRQESKTTAPTPADFYNEVNSDYKTDSSPTPVLDTCELETRPDKSTQEIPPLSRENGSFPPTVSPSASPDSM